ncbi:MAG: PDZ domain-containing protein [Planctomycetaceae bacterium]
MKRTTFALLLAVCVVLPARAEDEPPAFLGVSVAPVNEETRALHDLPADLTEGAVLLEVHPGSPAEKAGFRPGDVILHFDGKTIRTTDELVAGVRARRPGNAVTYVLRRGTGKMEGSLELGTRPATEEAGEAPAPQATPQPRRPLVIPLDVVRLAPFRPDTRMPRFLDLVIPRDVVRLAPPTGQMHLRLVRVQEQLAEFHARLAAQRAGTGWEDRIASEENALQAAVQAGDHAQAARRQVRLELLRELAGSGAAAPQDRIARMEAKLDAILEQLAQRR